MQVKRKNILIDRSTLFFNLEPRFDEGWKPDSYGYEVIGCRHTLEFPVVKLIEYADRLDQLETDPNPFAIVTAAHLQTRQTKHDAQARYHAKRTLVRLLYRHGWERQRVLDLFAVLDWMMRLAKPKHMPKKCSERAG